MSHPYPYPAIASFLFMLAIFGHPAADAGTPVGQVTQLSGFVMAVKASGVLKVLSPQSMVEAGDTLVSEEKTYVRLGLADGRQVVLGPQTRLEFTSESRLNLATGQLQVLAAVPLGAPRPSIVAGETTVDFGTASFDLFYRPDPAAALARRAYARASLALAASPVQSDAGNALPLFELVATTFIAQTVSPLLPGSTPSNPSFGVPPPGLAPGLHVFVADGMIVMSNSGGSQNFSAGQFGYVRSSAQPPIIVPNNPALKFTPPPVFSNTPAPGNTSNMPKPDAIDCEVR
jgi:hypothetical protein